MTAYLKRLREQNLNMEFPQFCKDYEEYEQLRQLQRDYSKIHAELMKKVGKDIQEQNLKADAVIRELFELSTSVPIDESIQERARKRIEFGNPPGKQGSLGDALNWEALLTSVPDGEDISFVTDDKDFSSPLDNKSFNAYLIWEWETVKKSSLFFYKSLSPFFKAHFPKISLLDELVKDLIISRFAFSESFAKTHEIIAELRQYSGFSMSQVNAIIRAAIRNNQIYWIIEDRDVKDFLNNIITGKEEHINVENLAELKKLLASVE